MSEAFSSFTGPIVEDAFSMAEAIPLPDLQGRVLRYQGFEAMASSVFRERVPADLFLPVIINFGAHWQIATGGENSTSQDSFVAGVVDRFTEISADGKPACLQIDFTPFGARAFLGQPLHEIASSVLPLVDVLGAEGRELIDRLGELQNWRDRLLHADRFVRRRLGMQPPPDQRLLHAWRMMRETDGAIPVSDVAAHLDLSREHFSRLFRETAGQSPKTIARIMRFQSARARASGLVRDWAGIAHDTGFSDQSHLVREFGRMTGQSPTRWAASHSFNTA